jgi:DNA-binding SARP family transcriptional activator/tetratricopeptide (TPR) repeat protein
VEFRVLGPLEVGHAGDALDLGSAKQRAVLALLILHAPEPVSAEQLIDALWGERPPASALHAVQVYISGIRKMLRGAGSGTDPDSADAGTAESVASSERASVVRGSSGYRLVVDSDRVDAFRFEQLVEEGRRALREDAFDDADRVLSEALGLWRGPALADFLFMDFAQTDAARLEELRVESVEARLEARVGLGHYAGVVGELEALVAEHPLREHARWLLMRAMYGAGRQADALAVYRAGRLTLSQELGLEPGRELRELEQAILRQAEMTDPQSATEHAATGSRSPPTARPALPSGVRGVTAADYVGRAEGHELVSKCWDAAREGVRHGVLVSGEPGIGKTEFAFRAAREFHSAGALVLYGHCPEELAAPYGAWIQALSPFVEQASDEALAAYAQRHGGELTRLIPALGRRLPQAPEPRQTDPESERYLLFSAVVGLLEQASADAPVALLIDDLHWADTTTLALLKHVVAETAELRLLVLATYRDSELSRDHPLTAVLADLRREQRIERLRLPGLNQDDVRSLVEEASGGEANGAVSPLAQQITAETGGNPFFVGEILRHLSESGVLAKPASVDHEPPPTLDLGLPQSVREVIGRRVERLGEDCRDVLSCASVIGPRFDFDLLGRVVHVDEDRLIDLLDVAVQACLVHERPEPSGSFSFAHDLINHALYAGLGTTRRSRVHRRVAEALEDLCAGDVGRRIEELARHWIAASDPDKGATYSKQAGEQALAKLAPDEAVRWFLRALEMRDTMSLPDQEERCELHILLGEAQRQAGRPEFRATLLHAAELAEEMGDSDRMARAALANSRGFASNFGAVDGERVAVLERAVELTRLTDPARCARLLSLQAMEMQFDPDYRRRRALADEALALARAVGDDRTLPYVLRDHFHATWAVDTVDARRRTAEEMMDLAAGADDPLVGIWALDRTVHAAAESGRLAQASEALDALLILNEQLHQPGLRWHATYYAAGLAHLRGELDEAERLAEEAARLGEQGAEPDMIFIYFGQTSMVRVEQGRGSEVVDVLEQATANNPAVPAYGAAHAAVLCDVGRNSDAAPRLAKWVDRGFAGLPRDQIYSTALALWAKVAADVGSERAAAPLYDLIEPWRDQFVWNGANGYGSAEYYLGILAATLGSHERASEHFVAASRVHNREGVKIWEARNLCYWADSLLASGATDAAIAKAEKALTLARENNYRFSAGRAEELLKSAAVAR